MRFYVSWYPGDPCYPFYDSDCALLVSISSVSIAWTIKKFPKYPCYLMIDSGGFRFATTSNSTHLPKKNLERQLAIIADTGIPSIISALDYPILDSSFSSNEKDHKIHQTIAYAYELKNMLSQRNLSQNVTPMGIIQGDNVDSICHCAHELKSIGFSLYGLGSLALLKDHRRIIERVQAVIPIIGADKLHVLGVNAISTVLSLRKIGVHSVDSARAAKAAAYNEVFYSNPFRRFGIFDKTAPQMEGKMPISKRLSFPLPCECPACLIDPYQILGVGKRENIRSRALHNYYHLKQTFCE
jgi:7-cyano-7-deazaguanine tRNA-ribosyltransferase